MKLKDFIEKLEDFEWVNQDLIVKIADWNEDYVEPMELDTDKMVIIGDSLVLGRSELEWYEKKLGDK